MRVIAGSARGRPLRVPRGRTVRPTSDRVREAIFSSLGDAVIGAQVLDLYAGTGALGIEALSRGAAAATFVEPEAAVVEVLTQNLRSTDVNDDAVVVRATAAAFAQRRSLAAFDLVFCDPPYAMAFPDIVAVLQRLSAAGGLSANAVVVVERDKRDPALAGNLEAHGLLVEDRRRSYGDTTVVYLSLDQKAPTCP